VSEAKVAEEAVPAGELALSDRRLLFGTADDALELVRVKPPGGREMDAASFVRGHAV